MPDVPLTVITSCCRKRSPTCTKGSHYISSIGYHNPFWRTTAALDYPTLALFSQDNCGYWFIHIVLCRLVYLRRRRTRPWHP